MLRKIVSALRSLRNLPSENQRLRAEVKRLAEACDHLQRERNQWQELHREASAGYMASQELLLGEIARLSKASNIEPDAKLSAILGMYDDKHRTTT